MEQSSKEVHSGIDIMNNTGGTDQDVLASSSLNWETQPRRTRLQRPRQKSPAGPRLTSSRYDSVDSLDINRFSDRAG